MARKTAGSVTVPVQLLNGSTKISAPLDRAFHCQVKKRCYTTERIETVRTTTELEDLAPVPDWTAKS